MSYCQQCADYAKELDHLRALLKEAVEQELPRLQEVQLIYEVTELRRFKAAALTLTTQASIDHVLDMSKEKT